MALFATLGDSFLHITEQLQLVLRNDHLNKTGHNSKNQLPKFDSVKRLGSLSSSNIKPDIPIKRLRNGIFIKSNTKHFTEFTNCNLSQRLVELTLIFFNDVEGHCFPLTIPNRTSNGGIDFFLQSPEFYSCIQFEIRKRLAC